MKDKLWDLRVLRIPSQGMLDRNEAEQKTTYIARRTLVSFVIKMMIVWVCTSHDLCPNKVIKGKETAEKTDSEIAAHVIEHTLGNNVESKSDRYPSYVHRTPTPGSETSCFRFPA